MAFTPTVRSFFPPRGANDSLGRGRYAGNIQVKIRIVQGKPEALHRLNGLERYRIYGNGLRDWAVRDVAGKRFSIYARSYRRKTGAHTLEVNRSTRLEKPAFPERSHYYGSAGRAVGFAYHSPFPQAQPLTFA